MFLLELQMPLIGATAVHYAGSEKRPKTQVALEKQTFNKMPSGIIY